jgi:superfamily I DNA and/or RNA helicase
MFERLINNNIPYATLKYQRRMKPKFADFVRIIYGNEDYIDHDDVKDKPDVKGMEKDMFFITHNELEGENEGLKSKQNDYEAIYLTKLCRYLLKQGYSNNQITILTFYVGQVLLIKKYMKKFGMNDIRVSSVDNYQGEESDIILLSLVRSNKKNEIGFLRNFNRVCVAFSRAKIGLYIIGNINFIAQSEAIFKTKNLNNIGKKLDPKMMDVWEKNSKKVSRNEYYWR